MDPAWAIAVATLIAGWLLRRQNKKHHEEQMDVLREQKTVYILDAEVRENRRRITQGAERLENWEGEESSESTPEVVSPPPPPTKKQLGRGAAEPTDQEISELRRRRALAATDLRAWARHTIDAHRGDDWERMRPIVRARLNEVVHQPFLYGADIVGIASIGREHVADGTFVDLSLLLKSLYTAAGIALANLLPRLENGGHDD